MAPEVIRRSIYNEKTDVYSYGIILSEIAMRVPPYMGIDKLVVAKNVSIDHKYRPRIDSKMPIEFANLMKSCWDHDGNKRPSFKNIIEILIEMDL